MKRLLKILAVLMVCFIIFFAAAFFYIKSRPVASLEVGKVEMNNVQDGTYRGEYASGPVEVVVDVVVKDYVIKDIDILKHQNGLGKKAEIITEEIVRAQSLEVEAISGATYSSRVIIKAVETALQKGKI